MIQTRRARIVSRMRWASPRYSVLGLPGFSRTPVRLALQARRSARSEEAGR